MSAKPTLARKSYSLTDMGNAERFSDQYGEGIRFCEEGRKWFVWDGVVWRPRRSGVVQLGKKMVRAMRSEGSHLSQRWLERGGELDPHAGPNPGTALTRWAVRSEQARSIRAMLEMAEAEEGLIVLLDSFDQDPWLLNLPNGTIELKRSHFRSPRSQDLITKTTAVRYEPEARCPRWLRFLAEVFRPNPDVIPFLQQAVGYSLTGDVREECLFILCGKGRNGKGVFMDMLLSVLGDYAGVAEIDALLEARRIGPQEDVADMCGLRVVSAQEPRARAAFDSSLVKWLTGGDRLRARRLYGHLEDFRATHKVWLCVNRVPRMPSDDDALWSRIRVIPFDVCFAGREDRHLKVALLKELPGILNWAILGCKIWNKNGLSCPRSVLEATERCRRQGASR
jgi:putative DNA primase/helicase